MRRWLVSIPRFDVLTQALHFEDVPLMAAEAVACVLDVAVTDVEVDVVLSRCSGVREPGVTWSKRC